MVQNQKNEMEHQTSTSLKSEGKYEDVEFSREAADMDDMEALERAEKADERQQQNK